MYRRWPAGVSLLAFFVVLGAIACGTQQTADRSDPPPDASAGGQPRASRQSVDQGATRGLASALPAAVNSDGVWEHARRFQEIADAHGGNRAAGTPGYDLSARYVAEELRRAGYEVTVQSFEFPSSAAFRDADLEATGAGQGGGAYELNKDFVLMEHSAGGEAQAPLVDVGSSTGGCAGEDFAGFARGSVALLRRGTCSFEQKALNAEEAGAAAVVISNSGEGGLLRGTLGGPGIGIPVLGTSAGVGEELLSLARSGGTQARVFAAGTAEDETTNVIAETPGGDASNTVMVGAHLDSVPQGPGINDNASGSATVLEIAQEMTKLGARPRNRVRFAFWGAEELGLVGSRHYVDGLEAGELDDISGYLNFDMVGSPNFVRAAYEGPAEMEDVFAAHFEDQGMALEFNAALDGRSDHGPFQDKGIPTGGLFSGAGGVKTKAQAATFDGEPGVPYDRCYHRACDDMTNLNRHALDQLSDGAAHATAALAQRSLE